MQTGDQGRLLVDAFLEQRGMPAENVTVNIASDESTMTEQLVTNSSGQTHEIALPAPPIAYSMAPNQGRPYSPYNLTIELLGYKTVQVNGVQVFPGSLAVQEVVLEPAEEPGTRQTDITIREPVLWGDFPEKIPEDPVKPLPPPMNYIVLPDPVIPEFIVVHNGDPADASAVNHWVRFTDYIKNVASCEIYANWPESTIRANVLAILSFTLNRVYTEWYRSKGYNFTITNSTAYDQAFDYGRNIFQEISEVVDEVFTTFITKPNIKQPLFTQYCDGKNVQCPGWLSQWGSKDLGDQGKNSIDILKTYYGSDIYLMQAAQVEGVPSSFPGHNLQIGSQGSDVRIIQQQLNAIADHYPAIGKVAADSVYGDKTLAAVETFQKVFGLPSTGIVDFATWYKISQIYVAVTKMAELV